MSLTRTPSRTRAVGGGPLSAEEALGIDQGGRGGRGNKARVEREDKDERLRAAREEQLARAGATPTNARRGAAGSEDVEEDDAEGFEERASFEVKSTGRGLAAHAVSIRALEPPVLEYWDVAALRTWREKWRRYCLSVETQQRQGYGVRRAPIRACLSDAAIDYVEALIFQKDFDTVSDAELEAKVDATLGDDQLWVEPGAVAAEIAAAWRSSPRTELTAKVGFLFTQIFRIFRSRGISLDAAEKWKRWVIGEVGKVITPPAFRRRVEVMRRVDDNFPEDDLRRFHDLLLHEARGFEQYGNPGPEWQGLSGGSRRGFAAPVIGAGGHTYGSKADDAPTWRQRETRTCYSCGREGHVRAHCPVLAVEDRRKASSQLRAEGKLDGEKRRATSQQAARREPKAAVRGVAPQQVDGQVTCVVDGDVELPCILDSGAGMLVMGRNHLAMLQSRDKFVKIRQLAKPVWCHPFTPDREPIACRLVVDVRLEFKTRWGRVKAPPCPVHVLDGDLDLVFIGEPVLRPMGWMPDQQMEVAAKRSASDIAELAGLKEAPDAQAGEQADAPPDAVVVAAGGDEDAGADSEAAEDVEYEEGTPQLAVSPTDVDEVQSAVREMVRRAVDDGLPTKIADEMLPHLLGMDIWRTQLGADPPASVPPYRAQLKQGARPFRAKARKQSDSQRESLREELMQMKQLGLMYENPSAAWGSAGMHVPKPGGRGMRLVVDLRGVNSRTETVSWPLPDHERQERALRGAAHFATFDLFKGFWQVALHPESQPLYTVVTDFGSFTPTRMPMGATAAAQYFQYCVTSTLDGLVDRCAQVWIDDLLVYSESIDQHVENVLAVLRALDAAGWKADPRKAVLWSDRVRWCGKVYSAAGTECDPARVKAVLEMEPPTTLGQLQQLLGALSWMRMHLPDYAKTVAPLQELLDKGLADLPKRSRRYSDRVPLEQLEYGELHAKAFAAVKQMLASAVRLAHHDPSCDVLVFTDASEAHWAVACVQTPAEDADLPIQERRMEPLAFLSGAFLGASRRWSIVDKEAYPLVRAVDKLDFLLIRQRGFVFMTDHRNLRYIFEPERTGATVRKATLGRVQRWALELQRFDYRIEHVPGASNLWADLLTRWAAPPVRTQVRAIRFQLDDPTGVDWNLVAPASEGFEMPRLADLQAAQQQAIGQAFAEDPLAPAPARVNIEGFELSKGACDDLWKDNTGRIWVPAASRTLQLRLCVLAHAGPAGHRGVRVTFKSLATRFVWSKMKSQVREFVRGCLHCRGAKGPALHPRPWGSTLVGEKPNQVVHFDFLYLKPAQKTGYSYVLTIRDAFSGYVDLVPASDTTAFTAATALLGWMAHFGTPEVWVSDRGPHFFNHLVAEIARQRGVEHHFTTARCPWANGQIERVNKEVLTLMKTMLSELRLPTNEWPALLPCVVSVLNATPSPSRGDVSPYEVFLGRKEAEPLDLVLSKRLELQLATVEDLPGLVGAHVQRLRDALDGTAERVRGSVAARTAGKQPYDAEFEEGAYVLYSEVHRERDKLQSTKVGPMLVVEAKTPWVYRLRDVVTGREVEAHAQRMQRYRDAELGITDALREHVSYHVTNYEVEKILEARKESTSGQWQFLVKWWGFADAEASWENVEILVEDAPTVVERFLGEADVPEECRRYVAALLKV